MSDEMGFNEQREHQPTVSGHVEPVVIWLTLIVITSLLMFLFRVLTFEALLFGVVPMSGFATLFYSAANGFIDT